MDIDIYKKKKEGSLGHKVYQKPTRNNLYLHQYSHYHSVKKQSVIASLKHRAKTLCDQDSFTQELEFLTIALKNNGYSTQQIRRAMEQATRTAKTNDKPTSTAYIPYTQTTYGRLRRMLPKHDIKISALPSRGIFSYLPPVKDALGLSTPGIYSIPCESGRVYIGQSGRSIKLRIKEHNRHIRLAQPDKSAVAEHSINNDHIIKLQDSSLIKADAWIDSYRKVLNLKCTHITSI